MTKWKQCITKSIEKNRELNFKRDIESLRERGLAKIQYQQANSKENPKIRYNLIQSCLNIISNNFNFSRVGYIS